MSALLLFSGVALLTTLSPGPAVLFTIHNTLTAGARAAWRGALGNATGLLLVAAAGFAGVTVLLSRSVLAFTVLKVAGSAYLIYLAFHQWRQARDLTALTVAAAPAKKKAVLARCAGSTNQPKSLVVYQCVVAAVSRCKPANSPPIYPVSAGICRLLIVVACLLVISGPLWSGARSAGTTSPAAGAAAGAGVGGYWWQFVVDAIAGINRLAVLGGDAGLRD